MLQNVNRKSLGLDRMPNFMLWMPSSKPTKKNQRCAECYVRLCIARVKNERASQKLDATFMFSDVGESAAGEPKNVRSIRVYGDCTFRLVARALSCGGKIRDKRKVCAEGVEQR